MDYNALAQAIVMAMQQAGVGSGGDNNMTMEVDSQTFAQVIYRLYNREARRMGVSLQGV